MDNGTYITVGAAQALASKAADGGYMSLDSMRVSRVKQRYPCLSLPAFLFLLFSTSFSSTPSTTTSSSFFFLLLLLSALPPSLPPLSFICVVPAALPFSPAIVFGFDNISHSRLKLQPLALIVQHVCSGID